METNPPWRDWTSCIRTGSNQSSVVGTDFTCSQRLKRRRVDNAEAEDAEKKAKRKLIKENCDSSPLLQLPPEIRRLIFSHVLGGEHVHVEQLHLGNIVRYEKKDISFGQGLWNEICHEPDEETSAYSRFRAADMGGEDALPTPLGKTKDGADLGSGYHVDSWTYRHRSCGHEPRLNRFNIELEEWMQRARLSTSSLRTCKAIYQEMRLLPYSSNTFLFRNPATFQAFAATCRPDHFRAIQYLSVPVAIGSAPFSEGRSKAWTSILWDYNLTGRIRRLRILSVTVEMYFPRDVFRDRPHQPKPGLDDCIEELRLSGTNVTNVSTDWTRQFALLSRQHIADNIHVVVADDPLSMWGVLGKTTAIRDWGIRDVNFWIGERNLKCLTVEQKQKLAEELEERLIAERQE